MYALVCTGWPTSEVMPRTKSMIGGQNRCRPCNTIVAPAANSVSTPSGSTWSGISAPNPPVRVKHARSTSAPSRAIRMNGVRNPRSAMISSTIAGVSRSEKSRGRRAAGLSRGC